MPPCDWQSFVDPHQLPLVLFRPFARFTTSFHSSTSYSLHHLIPTTFATFTIASGLSTIDQMVIPRRFLMVADMAEQARLAVVLSA